MVAGSGGMGLDFRHRRRIEGDFQQIASVAGSHDPVACQPVEQFARPGQRIEAGIVLPGFDDLAVLPYGQLDGPRADIDSHRTHGLLPSPSAASSSEKIQKKPQPVLPQDSPRVPNQIFVIARHSGPFASPANPSPSLRLSFRALPFACHSERGEESAVHNSGAKRPENAKRSLAPLGMTSEEMPDDTRAKVFGCHPKERIGDDPRSRVSGVTSENDHRMASERKRSI